MLDMLFIVGYIFYVVKLVIKLIYYRDIIRAYMALSFEREAHAHQDEVDYLKRRKWLSVLRYVLI